MRKKKLPKIVQNSIIEPIFQSKIGRIGTNWVLQGMLYMNPVEVIFKLFIDFVLLIIILLIIGNTKLFTICIGLIVAHTINWIINGQPIAMLRHLDWGHNRSEKFISYIENMYIRVNRKKYLKACASYGSLSTGKYHSQSDIDIRFIMRPGLVNKIRTAALCFYERLRAFVYRFPLDLYAFDMYEAKRKMSKKEVPVIFYDPEGLLHSEYGRYVEFDKFCRDFRSSHV